MSRIKDNLKIGGGHLKKGFTLIELLVTLSIFAITTGIVMTSQGKFDNSVLLTNLAYDVAITIRQAQTYGVNNKEFGVNGAFVAYGISFDLATGGDSKRFNLFADTNKDYKFSDLDIALPTFSCPKNSAECVDTYKIKRGSYIKSICAGDSESSCQSVSRLDISFKRPNPEAVILADTGIYLPPTDNRKNYAKIVISSSDNSSLRSIIVTKVGQIYVKNQ